MTGEVFTSSFAGALFGVLAGFSANIGIEFARNYFEQKREREVSGKHRSNQAKLLSDALYGEIRSVRDIIKQYQIIAESCLQAVASCGGSSEVSDPNDHLVADLRSLSTYEAKVYERRLGDVGLLWQRLARETTEFYGRFEGLKRYASCVADAPPSVRRERLKRLSNESNALRWEATELLSGLGRFSRGKPYPKKRPRTLNGLLTEPDTIEELRPIYPTWEGSAPPLQEQDLQPRHIRALADDATTKPTGAASA